jgi:hypothetical protein
MVVKKPTVIPEREKSPNLGVTGAVDGWPGSGAHQRQPQIEPDGEDDTDDRFADEDGPRPIDKLFR